MCTCERCVVCLLSIFSSFQVEKEQIQKKTENTPHKRTKYTTMSTPIIHNISYKYGFHVPKRPKLVDTVKFVVSSTPFVTAQIYISNGRAVKPVICDPKDAVDAGRIASSAGLKMFIHSSLCHNLCGTADSSHPGRRGITEKMIVSFTSEMDVGVCLGATVVIHTGSCDDDENKFAYAARAIVKSLALITPQTRKLAKEMGVTVEDFVARRSVALENSAGEGTKIGRCLDDFVSIFEEMDRLVAGVEGGVENIRSQVGVCIDTAHSFGAGDFDFGLVPEIDRFYSEFEEKIGLDRLKLFHLNDSRRSKKKTNNADFGSKKDRHENLGLGYIFDESVGMRRKGLVHFFHQALEYGVCIVGEPPAVTDSGEPAPGGRRDWGYVCDMLKETHSPMMW